MKFRSLADRTPSQSNQASGEGGSSSEKKAFNRRSFLRNSVVAGAAVTAGAAILENVPSALAQSSNGRLTRGDAAILRWLAAAEMIETDLWLQYQELAGTQDNEVSTIASQQIPGYPSQPSGGNSPYTNAVLQLDGDMDQYIHDNTEDELTHETSWAHTLHQWGFSLLYLQKFSNFLLPSRNISPAVSV